MYARSNKNTTTNSDRRCRLKTGTDRETEQSGKERVLRGVTGIQIAGQLFSNFAGHHTGNNRRKVAAQGAPNLHTVFCEVKCAGMSLKNTDHLPEDFLWD